MVKVSAIPNEPQFDNRLKKGVDLSLNNIFIKGVLVLSFVCQMLVLFNRGTFEYMVGPVMTVCFVVLTFTPYYYVPFAIVLLTPHALGTVFMGRLSIYMLLGFLLVLRLFVVKFKTNFVLIDLAWLVLGLFNCAHLYWYMFDHVGSEKLTYMVIFTLWIIYLRIDNRRDTGLINNFILAFGAAITTNAAVSLVARTATKYAASDRMGLIGIGSNDPNIAAMMLSLGIAIIISTQKIKMWIKIVCLMVLFFSLITTVSISGLFAAALVILGFSVIMNKNRHNLSVLLVLILGAVLAIYLFPMLGIMGEENAAGETVNYLEYYQEKLYDRFSSFVGNDVDSATSGRTELTRMNLEYFSEQSAMKQLFGGNHVNPLGVNVSHNTFADNLLRFGYVGSFVIILILIYSFVRSVQRTRATGNSTLLLCKLLMIYWSLTLSLFDGSVAILWFTLVLML